MTEAVTGARSVLAQVQERLGGVWDAGEGGARGEPLRYRRAGEGQLAAEYSALRGGVGVAGTAWTGGLELTGADRLRFLNAYVTCDVKELKDGELRRGFFTTAKGGILADVTVLVLPDRLWLEVPAGREQPLAAHLRKFIIADRVEVGELAGQVRILLVGPATGELLGRVLAGGLPAGLEAGGHCPVQFTAEFETHLGTGRPGAETRIASGDVWHGEPAFSLWTPVASAPALFEALAVETGALPVGTEALEALRVEAGLPRFGSDFGPENFPQETGIEEAVSYSKGCYLGQEVVARIHYRGGVQKALRGLVFPVEARPRPGAALLFEGREAGRLGTVAFSPALGCPVGLAILHRRATDPGIRLEVVETEPAGERWSAEVRALPLVAPRGSPGAES